MSNRPNHRETRQPTSIGIVRVLAPLAVGLVALASWEALVWWRGIPVYVLPAPSAVVQAAIEGWATLSAAWLVTLKTTFLALVVAVMLGVALAVVFSLSRVIETSFFPYAVVLQVTPIVAIAPLIMVWVENRTLVLLICAWIVAFFPILSNTTIGLRSADEGLHDLFRLYGATPWQRLRLLLAPSALPYFLAGLKISGNLALVGAVVAEFVVGASGVQSGLASTILESSYQLNVPRMFAALALISLTGVAIFFGMHLLSWLLLRRWHESARPREA